MSHLILCHCLDSLQQVRLKDSPQRIRNTCRSCWSAPSGRNRNCYHLWFGKTEWTQFTLPCRAPRKTFWPCHFNKHIQSVKQNQQTNSLMATAKQSTDHQGSKFLNSKLQTVNHEVTIGIVTNFIILGIHMQNPCVAQVSRMALACNLLLGSLIFQAPSFSPGPTWWCLMSIHMEWNSTDSLNVLKSSLDKV